MSTRRLCKRDYAEVLDGEDSDAQNIYKFQILLPDGTTTRLTLHDPEEEMFIDEFVHAVKKVVETSETRQGLKRKIQWSNDIYLEDMQSRTYRKKIHIKRFKANKCHILRVHDGAEQAADTFHNMWDLTPDTDLLAELPADYTFETALADLIDNSLQAVWSNGQNETRMVSVTVEENKLVIFDSGPGMDGSEQNSVSKWGKMGSSNHRSFRKIGIGGKPPYLKPYFGMFGYGGPVASMHLGSRTIVSSKTRESRKVYTLHLSRETLLSKTSGKCIWRTDGGIRDPSGEEIELSPHGSFTQVEILDLKLRSMETPKLQCLLKDIYFPYIQYEEPKSGRTIMPVKFQVNGTDLAEIEGGEVAVTNIHSCNGPDFVLQLNFVLKDGEESSSSRGVGREANARLKFVYFPIVEGKESIARILEKLDEDGNGLKENFNNFSRLSIRRLGRLLPDARWRSIPLMDFKSRKGERGQVLMRCCNRVKCFVDTDAGFSPTPSKTDLAHKDPFTLSLRNFGNKPSGKESDANVKIHKDGKQISLIQLEKEYQAWILKMHEAYDEELERGEDEPVIVIDSAQSIKKKLGISSDVVRVHKEIRRNGQLWKSGQKVKILKGAPGCGRYNMYATLEYILLEGFQGDAGGEARLVCRPMGSSDNKGCLLINDGNPSLVVYDSVTFPISVIDKGLFRAADATAWANQAEKMKMERVTCKGSGFMQREGNVTVRPSKIEKWSICDKEGTADHSSSLLVRAGSCIPNLYLACFDSHSNKIPISVTPEIKVLIKCGDVVLANVDNMEVDLTLDLVEIQDILIESCKIDTIRPNYNAVLQVCSSKNDFMAEIPIKVMPGPISSVKLHCSSDLEKTLRSDIVIEEIELEFLDAFGNHIEEGTQFSLNVDGFCFIDNMGSLRKVNALGRFNLGHLLKVTADYGSAASITVFVNNKVMFEKFFHVPDRKLKDLPMVPDCSFNGHEFTNISESQNLDVGTPSMKNALPLVPQSDLMIKFLNDNLLKLDKQSETFALLVGAHEKKLKELIDTKEKIEQEICALEGSLEPRCLTRSDALLNNSKEHVAKIIEEKSNSAAAVFSKFSKTIQLGNNQPQIMTKIVGIVALLGTVSNVKLSSVLAEYIGEKYMLAIVCDSRESADYVANYASKGELRDVAVNMGITISKQFPVICLEELRPYTGQVIGKNPQKPLALPFPLLPNGKEPDGFLGHAVNMINLDKCHVDQKFSTGYGLRQTLLYRLFGRVEVYETRQQMNLAKDIIEYGAVSLDGGIMRENGFLLFGDCEPEIKFPVRDPVIEKGISKNSVSILQELEDKKTVLQTIQQEVESESEARLKALAKFKKKTEKVKELVEVTKSFSQANR